MAVYRGEAARRQGEVHYGFSLLPTACDQPDRDLPPQDRVSRLSSQVTCERCLTALTTTRRGPVHLGLSRIPPDTACGESMGRLPLTDTWTVRLQDVTCTCCLDAVTASP